MSEIESAMLADAIAVFEGLFESVEDAGGAGRWVTMTHEGRKAEGEGGTACRRPRDAVTGWLQHAVKLVRLDGVLVWQERPALVEYPGAGWVVSSRFAIK